jgi:phage shock protein PspC (stress-responsive transcriptional regulator)
MRRFDSISRRRLYRSRDGIILGVCRGVADYFNFSAFWIRAIVIVVFIFSGFWPIIGIYILAALLMKSAPGVSGCFFWNPENICKCCGSGFQPRFYPGYVTLIIGAASPENRMQVQATPTCQLI